MATKWVTPVKVGLLFVGSIAAFAAYLQIVSTRGVDRSGSYEVFAVFTDVLGLEKKSPVQIAGIDVGAIKTVELFQGKAKVTLNIDKEVDLYEDALIEKVSVSLLGDFKLRLDPGHSTKRKLVNGDEIKNVTSLSNTDAIIAEVRKVSESINALVSGTPEHPAPLEMIVRDVQASAGSARIVLDEVSRNIGANARHLDDIVLNVDRITNDLAGITGGRERDVDSIMKDSRAIAHSLRVTSEALEKIVAGRNEGDISESVKSLRQTLDTMNRSLERIESIAKKIDEGSGTIGALVNERQLHDNAAEAVEGVNEILGGVGRLQTWVNLRSEYEFRAGATKNYVQFTLMPKEDSFYIFEVVDDPRGVTTTVIDDVNTTSPEAGRNFQYRERRTSTVDGLKFSLEFAKRYYWLTLRFGIIEGRGGIGADAHFLEDRLHFLVDANQFGDAARNPRLKVLAALEIIPHVYLHGGVDDFLNPGTVDYFMGAGIRFNDEDLKTLLLSTGGAVPKGK